ncbi:MAG: hypothetical protein WDN29_05620 [Methylovirgula sp.]
MRTKTQIEKVSGRHVSSQPGDAPEVALIAILVAMVLLRILDVYSPPASATAGCAPTHASRAVISCAVRGDQTWDASSTQAAASLSGRR